MIDEISCQLDKVQYSCFSYCFVLAEKFNKAVYKTDISISF